MREEETTLGGVGPLPAGERLARLEAVVEAQTKNVDRMLESVGRLYTTRDEGWGEFRQGIANTTQICARLDEWRDSCKKSELGWQEQLRRRAVDVGLVAVGFFFWLLYHNGFKPF